jgi:hypothetical protein
MVAALNHAASSGGARPRSSGSLRLAVAHSRSMTAFRPLATRCACRE